MFFYNQVFCYFNYFVTLTLTGLISFLLSYVIDLNSGLKLGFKLFGSLML